MQAARTTPIIPRAKLFGAPARTDCQILPDGQWLSWTAFSNGVLNIWVVPVGDLKAARTITDDRGRGIRFHGWMPNGTHVFDMQDAGGAENWHIFAVEVASGAVRDLTPIRGVFADFIDVSRDRPNLIAAGLNDRDPAWHDLYTIDVRTGERELVLENKGAFAGFALDR